MQVVQALRADWLTVLLIFTWEGGADQRAGLRREGWDRLDSGARRDPTNWKDQKAPVTNVQHQHTGFQIEFYLKTQVKRKKQQSGTQCK